MGFLKLPGWIAIATGVLQFAIVVAGTIFGTFAGHVTTGNEYNRQRN